MLRFLASFFAYACLAASAAVTPLPGSSPQTATAGSMFSPVRVRVTDVAGNPVAGAYIYYSVGWYWSAVRIPPDGMAGCFPDLGDNCETVTDSNGVAELAPLVASYPGTTDIEVRAGTTRRGHDLGSTAIHLEVVTAGGTKASYQALWWGGPAENGWGISIVQHRDTLFNALFAYDSSGDPTWYVQPEGAWTRGVGSSFTGKWYSPRSAPFFAYDPARFVIGPALDAGAVDFVGPESALLNVAVGNTTRMAGAYTKSIAPLDFSPDTPRADKGISDLWWGGPAQNGWGVSIMENRGNLFAIWFTYDAAGKPVWFPMEAGSWVDERTYRGTIFRTKSSPWPAGYDASKLRISDVGTFTRRIDDLRHLRLEYLLEGRGGTLALERLDF